MAQPWQQILNGTVDPQVLQHVQDLRCVLQGRTARVAVYADTLLNNAQLASLKQALGQQLRGLDLQLQLRCPALREDFIQTPANYATAVEQVVRTTHAGCAQMLQQAAWAADNTRVTLTVEPTAYAYLSKEDCRQAIAGAVRLLFDFTPEISLLKAQQPTVTPSFAPLQADGASLPPPPPVVQAQDDIPPLFDAPPSTAADLQNDIPPLFDTTPPKAADLPNDIPPLFDAPPPKVEVHTHAMPPAAAPAQPKGPAAAPYDPPHGAPPPAAGWQNDIPPLFDAPPPKAADLQNDIPPVFDAPPAASLQNDIPPLFDAPPPKAAGWQNDIPPLFDAPPPKAADLQNDVPPLFDAAPPPEDTDAPADTPPTASPAQPAGPGADLLQASLLAAQAAPPAEPKQFHVSAPTVSLPDAHKAYGPLPVEGVGGKSKAARPKLEPAVSGEVLIGRAPRGTVQPIVEVTEDSGFVLIRGRVVFCESRPLRNPRSDKNNTLLQFDVSDSSSSISVKAFTTPEIAERFAGSLKKGNFWVHVRGQAAMDARKGELCLMNPHVSLAEAPPPRTDSSEQKRIELHLHTKMSAQDGFVDLKKLVETAKQMGHDTLAITDHGVVQAFPEAYEATSKAGIGLIYGMEGYLKADHVAANPVRKPRDNHHIIILVKDLKGLNNLYRLVTAGHLHHFYKRPLLPREVMQQHHEGLLFGSACEAGELFTAILNGEDDDTLRRIVDFYDFLEIQPDGNNAFLLREGLLPDVQALHAINKKIIALADQAGKPVVATGDVHFLQPQDAIYREVMMTAQGFSDADQQAPLYYRTTPEMLDEFSYLSPSVARRVVIEAPRAIAAQCRTDMPPFPGETYAPEIKEADDTIRQTAWDTCHQRYGEQPPEQVASRLEHELNLIINNNFGTLYWIALQLVRKSEQDGYVVGSRGSVGSSLVANMAGISEVNPLPPHYRCEQCKFVDFDIDKSAYPTGPDLPQRECPNCHIPLQRDGFDIPFEVFLGFGGEKVPDIDLNFSGDYQPEMHAYSQTLMQRFGGEVYKAGTIGTLAAKTCYGYVKKYQEVRQIPYLPTAEINRLVEGMEGVKRTTGQHPAGMVVVPQGVDVYDFTPLQYPANDKSRGMITTHFDFGSMKERLVKIDILGHDYPTMMHMMQEMTGVKQVPECHPDIMPLYLSCEPLGVTAEQICTPIGTLALPEFGTPFVRGILESTKPTTMDELIRIMGLSHGTNVWQGNANDLIQAGIATLRTCVCNRDDIFLFLRDKIDPLDAFLIMESVRKGKGLVLKKGGDREPVMREAGVAEWFIESCKKIQYMFPKAHATAYTIMANRLAYFKLLYPAAFYATVFTVRGDFDYHLMAADADTLRERFLNMQQASQAQKLTDRDERVMVVLQIVLEMACRGIKLLPIDLNISQAEKFVPEGDKAIRPPLSALPGLGPAAAQSIVAAREQAPFISVEDLADRGHAGKSIIEILQKAGCLNDLPQHNQLSLI